MGFSSRKPILPAPTESLVDSGVEEADPSELAGTELSRKTERSSATLPDDGSPVTLATGQKVKTPRFSKNGNQSQTSFVIEYQEGPKEPGADRTPSIRIRVRPSNASSKDKDGRLSTSQTQGSFGSSATNRVPLNEQALRAKAAEEEEVSDLEQVDNGVLHRAPFDIEIQHHGADHSSMSGSPELRYIVPESDVSSMPADSMLGIQQPRGIVIPSGTANRPGDSTLKESRGDLKPPVIPQERNLSHERITQKAIEKLSNKERDSPSKSRRRTTEKSRATGSRGLAADALAAAASVEHRRRRSHRTAVESSELSADQSQLSTSNVSGGAKSADGLSVRSGASNITNPKLLHAVEDAIRRLILPELKEIKRNGSVRTRPKEVPLYSESETSSVSREKAAQHAASGSKSRRRTSKDSGGGGSSSRRKERSQRDYDYDSMSEISSPRRESVSSVSEHRQRRSEKHDRARDLGAAALAGGVLTAAALHQRGSNSTLDDHDHRRRRKHSESRDGRGRELNESEEIFDRHEVPAMPFISEVGTDITRSSLLSSNTVSSATPTQREVREVIRGSPLKPEASEPDTPTRNSQDLRKSLGLHHQNYSEQDLSNETRVLVEGADTIQSPDAGAYSPQQARDDSSSPAFWTDPERMKQYERNLHQQHPIRRGLSPIQSVASYATTEAHRHSAMRIRSADSMGSMSKNQEALKNEVSIDSFMSASPDFKKPVRPAGINLESPSEIMHQHEDHDEDEDEDEDEAEDSFYDDQHSQNDRYRESYVSNDPKAATRHLTTYTDDSMGTPHLDKVTSGQQVADGFGANPEYVYTPPGVESAVASLIESTGPDHGERISSPRQSLAESAYDVAAVAPGRTRDLGAVKESSPLKHQFTNQSNPSINKTRNVNTSPPQSPAMSFEDRQPDLTHASSADHKATTSPESEITTNPSVIHGPIGGLSAGRQDHWQYASADDRATPEFSTRSGLNRNLGLGAEDLIPEALNVSGRNTYNPKLDSHGGPIAATPPGIKDEGYATGDNPRSPGLQAKMAQRAYTPESATLEDPFVTKRNQYMSGISNGMSPIYDSATGQGIEHIRSKDVVALMDHLTVRDAQRNARDTEILVTLVRTAAEMRNSFEDMKKFITEQDAAAMDASERQHAQTQKAIGGPRPQPFSRLQQRSLPASDELPNKRRNVFRRALQGLGSKNAVELQNIEAMLMQLLDEVEVLRTVQASHAPTPAKAQSVATFAQNPVETDQHRSLSVNSEPQPLTDAGYEPEGHAGTGSSRSGLHSGNTSRQTDYRAAGRRESINRVSTVMEGDENEGYDEYSENQSAHDQQAVGPSEQLHEPPSHSKLVSTPPKMSNRLSGPWSNDHTPHYVHEPGSTGSTGRRPKNSITSSIFGKGQNFISRWSKTTTSTTDPRYSTQQKGRPYSQVSRSGSDLGEFHYDPQPGDRLRSNNSLQDVDYQDDDRPPSPLVPSQVSDNPKYQGYRDSQNMMHPQPRHGPTGRNQHRLENEAIVYHDQMSPTSQTSSNQWGPQHQAGPAHGRSSMDQYVQQAPLSPIPDGGYSEVSDRSDRDGPQRPPKIRENDPLVPQRPPKVPMSPSNYVNQVAAARAGSPAYDKSPVGALRSPQTSARKPSGPRPLSNSGNSGKVVKGDLNTIKKTRFRGSPYHIDSDESLVQ